MGSVPLPEPALAERAPPRRAGRNLPAAIAVGVGLALLVVVPLYSAYRWVFVVVLVAAASVGTVEVVRALRGLRLRPPLPPLLAGGAGMVVVAYRTGVGDLVLALMGTALLALLWCAVDRSLADLASTVFTAVYVPFLVGFAALLAVPPDGPRRVTAFIATVVCSDVGGYVAGVLFGRHAMAPTVSPKKSWEGFAGSATACALAGALLLGLLFHRSPLLGVLYGLAVVVTATLGDLGESLIKRDLGIKDMGQLLPGHGGLMDRLDSLLPSAPVAWLLLTAFVPHP